jgi:hypothetical protein
MLDVARRLRDLDVALQQIARSPSVDERDRAVLEEAQHACNVGGDLLRSNRAVQAGYACFYAEACVAVLQQDMRSAELLRKLL